MNVKLVIGAVSLAAGMAAGGSIVAVGTATTPPAATAVTHAAATPSPTPTAPAPAATASPHKSLLDQIIGKVTGLLSGLIRLLLNG